MIPAIIKINIKIVYNITEAAACLYLDFLSSLVLDFANTNMSQHTETHNKYTN